ncbi:MAG TPA: hypothetical protein PKL15_05125 [Saprospiraceae bacterium]|nr:hypothetical protein [Saprospiraceae bacterium]HNL40303.1 hypothetical protein [Saprospiraceae bacterium]HNM24787.1 hypothetical protein [Saprospiraceae bacterium]
MTSSTLIGRILRIVIILPLVYVLIAACVYVIGSYIRYFPSQYKDSFIAWGKPEKVLTAAFYAFNFILLALFLWTRMLIREMRLHFYIPGFFYNHLIVLIISWGCVGLVLFISLTI